MQLNIHFVVIIFRHTFNRFGTVLHEYYPKNNAPGGAGIFFYLQPRDDGTSVLMGLGLATQVTSESLALGQSVEDGLLDAGSVVVELHVSQHHDGAE